MVPLSRRLIPLWLFIAFLAIYGLTAGVSLGRHSLAPHFVYLAEAFLHGRLDLVHVPDPPYDLTPFAGRWYISFPPLPALLMLPLVALRGLAVSDIAFSAVVGALDVALFWLVLQRLEIGDRRLGIGLCILLGLGTPLWYCAALGSVWYTAHVVAVGCLCLYALEALGPNQPLVAGLCLGLSFLARAPVLLAFPLSLVLGLQQHRGLRERVRFLVLFALGMAPALVGQAAYNWARFGSPLEFGYRWMNSPGPLAERQATWGQFSLHFLPENLYTLTIRPPLVSWSPLRLTPDPWGMGLLLTCPALVMIALTLSPLCPPPPLPNLGEGEGGWGVGVRLALWLSIALVQLPSLLYFNTGSYQFGYRFALDWLPLGVLLVGLGAGGRLRWWGKALIAASVIMHLWGVLWMYPNFNGQPWYLQYVELLGRLLR
jgi:hypothetical protein